MLPGSHCPEILGWITVVLKDTKQGWSSLKTGDTLICGQGLRLDTVTALVLKLLSRRKPLWERATEGQSSVEADVGVSQHVISGQGGLHFCEILPPWLGQAANCCSPALPLEESLAEMSALEFSPDGMAPGYC